MNASNKNHWTFYRNNTREVTTRLEELKIEHFALCHCQEVEKGSNYLMFQLGCSGVRYLSYRSVKYSFDITRMEVTTAATVPIDTATFAN